MTRLTQSRNRRTARFNHRRLAAKVFTAVVAGCLITANALAASAAAPGVAAAANDALSLTSARLPLARAVALAEQHGQGRATRAEIERRQGILVYQIELVKGTDVIDMTLDAQDGRVIATVADAADAKADAGDAGHHESGDEQDDEDDDGDE